MAVILTQRNRVVADDPEPGDVMVQVAWLAPGDDGKHLKLVKMPLRPITEYADMIDWAVSMADELAYRIFVMPFNHHDILHTSRFDPYRKFLMNLTDQERCEVRQIMIDAWISIMRDSDDVADRKEAFGMLAQLGVVTP